MTITLLSLLAGSLIGLGLAISVLAVAPTHPDLHDYLNRLTLSPPSQAAAAPIDITDYRDRLGLWLMRKLPLTRILTPPQQELALLRTPVHRFYAEKAVYALLGVVLPTIAAALLALIGIRLPLPIPVVAALVLGGVLSFLPDWNVHDDAKAARHEFRHALTAYVDLVAIARNSGAQPRQAMEMAARTGDSWVFARINEELVESRFSGRTPWDSLRALAGDLDLSELSDVADIMRLSAEDNAAVYATLRARAASMRNAVQSVEITRANSVNERMSMPAALLFIVFLAALATPVLLRVAGLA